MRKKTVAAFILAVVICATIFTSINQVGRADSTDKWRIFDKKTLYVHGYMVYRYNRNASSDVDVSISLWANNFWSEVSLLKTEPESVSSYVKYNIATEEYDIPADKDDQDAIYAATFFFTDVQPYQEIKAEVWIKLSISKVDTSLILSEQVGNVSDATTQLSATDYGRYTSEEYYWDYNNSSVKKVIEDIDANYSRGSQNIYDIVLATINWLSTNMVYMEHEDYPAQRLKASQILNETTEVAGVEKRYGVCRHFADAFVAIMRGFGVPTNLFDGLVFYDMGGDVGVVFNGGHAWCEVYMPNIGWVPVEVTISDRYLRDIVRVGLISEYYYLPTYKEFAHPAPKPPGEPEDKEPYEYLVGAYWGWGVGEVPPAGTLDSIIYAIKSTPVMVWILLAVIIILIVDSILIRRKIKALTSKVTTPPPPPPPSPTP